MANLKHVFSSLLTPSTCVSHDKVRETYSNIDVDTRLNQTPHSVRSLTDSCCNKPKLNDLLGKNVCTMSTGCAEAFESSESHVKSSICPSFCLSKWVSSYMNISFQTKFKGQMGFLSKRMWSASSSCNQTNSLFFRDFEKIRRLSTSELSCRCYRQPTRVGRAKRNCFLPLTLNSPNIYMKISWQLSKLALFMPGNKCYTNSDTSPKNTTRSSVWNSHVYKPLVDPPFRHAARLSVSLWSSKIASLFFHLALGLQRQKNHNFA